MTAIECKLTGCPTFKATFRRSHGLWMWVTGIPAEAQRAGVEFDLETEDSFCTYVVSETALPWPKIGGTGEIIREGDAVLCQLSRMHSRAAFNELVAAVEKQMEADAEAAKPKMPFLNALRAGSGISEGIQTLRQITERVLHELNAEIQRGFPYVCLRWDGKVLAAHYLDGGAKIIQELTVGRDFGHDFMRFGPPGGVCVVALDEEAIRAAFVQILKQHGAVICEPC